MLLFPWIHDQFFEHSYRFGWHNEITALAAFLLFGISYLPAVKNRYLEWIGYLSVFMFEAEAIYLYHLSGHDQFYFGTSVLVSVLVILLIRRQSMLVLYWAFANTIVGISMSMASGLSPSSYILIPALYFTLTTSVSFVQWFLIRTLTRSIEMADELEEKSASLNTLFEIGPDLIWKLDTWMRITLYNSAFQEMVFRFTGFQVFEGADGCSIFPEKANADTFRVHYRQALSGQKASFPLEIATTDGQLIYMEIYLKPIFQQSAVVSIACFARDLSTRKQLEANVERSEERYANAVSAANDGIWEWDVVKKEVFFSPRWKEMIGYTDHELSNEYKSWEDAIFPDDRDRVLHALTDLIRGRSDLFEEEFRMIHKQGHTVWIAGRGKAVRNASGRTLRLSGSHSDITAQKLAEAELRRISIVAHKTSNGVVISDAQGRIEWANDSFQRLSGYDLSEIIGKTPGQFIHGPLTSRESVASMREAMRSGLPVVEEILNYHKSGTPYWVRVTITPVLNQRGEIEKFIAIQDDISSQKETELQLRRAKQQAEEIAASKSEFLANMSHEIRTPLNAVIGLTGLLMDTPINEEQRDLIATIRMSGDNLLALINEILDFSKIEAGKLRLDPVPANLSNLVDEVIDLQATRASNAKIELFSDIHPDTPDWVVADPNRINQVLLNLVSNALKFTLKGQVVLSVRPISLREEVATIHFSVKDTGIGIPKDRQHLLFQSFSQVSGANNRKFGGVGLGLAISQKLINLMGGVITLESEEGKGAEFSFILSFQTTKAPGNTAQTPVFQKEKVLTCIGNPDLRKSVTHFLQRYNLLPVEISSCNGIVEASSSHPDSRLLICDGARFAASPEICSTLNDASVRLPKGRILLMPPGWDNQVQQDASRVFEQLIPRPIRRNQLLRSLSDLIHQQQHAGSSSHPEDLIDLSAFRFLNILLVEDNLVNQKVALRTLERLGLSADVASNGIEALQLIDIKAYDIVLMDIQMPEMDGYDATRAIRRLPIKQPAIIALTANAMEKDRQICLDAGMDDYLSKPYKAAQLGRILHTWLLTRVETAPEQPPV
jgi:PAS domain S-box-containing protein